MIGGKKLKSEADHLCRSISIQKKGTFDVLDPIDQLTFCARRVERPAGCEIAEGEIRQAGIEL